MKIVEDYMKIIEANSALKDYEKKKLMRDAALFKKIEGIEDNREYCKLACEHAISIVLEVSNSVFSMEQKDELCKKIIDACIKEVNAFDNVIYELNSALSQA